MRSAPTPLISGRIQYDNRCAVCGFEEREIRNERGHLLMWRNITLHKMLAQAVTGA